MTEPSSKIEDINNSEEKRVVVNRDPSKGTLIVGLLGMVIIWLPGERDLLVDLVKNFSFSSETIICFLFTLVWQFFGILFISLISAAIFGNSITYSLKDNKITVTERIGRIRTQKLKIYDADKISNLRIEEIPRHRRGRKWIDYDILFDYSGQKKNMFLLVSKEKTETFLLQFQDMIKTAKKLS